MTLSDALTRDMVATFPELEEAYQEHLEDNFGELLSTLFMSDVARWAVGVLGSRPDRVKALCDWLEAAYTGGDSEVEDLIGVGFVEMLPARNQPGGAILNLLGPNLRGVAGEMGLA